MEGSTENNVNQQEVELMRKQLAVLKKKVSDQQLVNEKFLRQIMRDKVKKINNDGIWVNILALVAIIYCTWVFSRLIFISTSFIVVTDAFLLMAIGYRVWAHRGIKAQNLLDGDLVQTRLKVARMKSLNARWLWFGIPFLIVWISWFCYEVINSNSQSVNSKYLIIGGLCGGVVGAILGFRLYRKNQRQALEVIEKIAEFTYEQ